jgi:DNA end-binding protein Ku
MSERKVWKGFLNLGMLAIPVGMTTGARDKYTELNNLHSKCNSKITMPKTCAVCEVPVPSDELVKGYATGGEYVLLSEAELESIAPATEKVMEITECVKWAEVDPMYLAESFYLVPEKPGEKAYGLLVNTLTDSRRVAIAQVTKNKREHVALIRPRGNGLVVHFLYYPDEVNESSEFNSLTQPELSGKEIKLAKQLVDSLESEFDPTQYENGYDQRLNQLIASKLDKAVKAPAPVKSVAAIGGDITKALEASLIRPRRKITLEEDESKKKAKGKKVA